MTEAELEVRFNQIEAVRQRLNTFAQKANSMLAELQKDMCKRVDSSKADQLKAKYAALTEEVIAEWNKCASAYKWRRCRGCDADKKKINSALRRKEFFDYWKDNADLLLRLGLPGSTNNGGYWSFKDATGKPTIQWFCSPSTHQKITDAVYWPDLQRKIDRSDR